MCPGIGFCTRNGPTNLGKQFANVQALRAVAAIAVVLFHMTFVFWNAPGTPPGWWPLPPMHYVGFAGVDVFFVISGFIIYTACARLRWTDSNPKNAATFLLRRIARIYPVYWLFFLFYAILLLTGVSRAFNTVWHWGNILRDSLLLTRDNGEVQVAWTLVFEMLFYAVTSATLLFGRHHYRRVLAAWIVIEVILCGLNDLFPFGTVASSIWLNPLLAEFGMGCAVGLLVETKTTRFWRAALIAWVPLFVLGGFLEQPLTQSPAIRVLTFGLGSAFAVYAICVAEWRGTIAPRGLIAIGNASYSIYLGHDFTIYATHYAALWLGISSPLGGFITLFAALTTSVGLGLVSYRYFERPITKFLHVRIDCAFRSA